VIRYVIDASCVGPLIVPDEAENLLPIVQQALEKGECAVPSHWRYEVGNLSLMAVRRGRARAAEVLASLRDLAQFTLETDDLSPQLAWSRSFELGQRHGLTLYDAAYLELAGRLSLSLLSMDGALVAAAAAEGVLANPES
jgi:predicted nucleic acid-binding protein